MVTPLPKLFIRVAKSSTNKLNSNGDKEQPCRKPDVMLNQLEYIPFILTQADTEVYNDLTTNKVLPEIPISPKRCLSLIMST